MAGPSSPARAPRWGTGRSQPPCPPPLSDHPLTMMRLPTVTGRPRGRRRGTGSGAVPQDARLLVGRPGLRGVLHSRGGLHHRWRQARTRLAGERRGGHQIIFSAGARDSRLAGRIGDIRFLTTDVAVRTAYGHILFPDRADTGKLTIYTATVQKLDGHWIFVGYQNTPLVA